MEELFQYMKTFRSQINDVADQAAKISVEEHMQCTTIQTLQKDLDSVKNETKKVMEEHDQINKAKAQICLQLLDKQKKIVLLESDSSTLSQTMELMRQEVLSLSGKLVDQRTHYKKVNEDICGQLKQQQEWVNAQNFGLETREGSVNKRAGGTKVALISNNKQIFGYHIEYVDNVDQREIPDFEAAQVKFDKIEQLRSNLVSENNKLRQSLEAVKNKMTEFKPELRDMDEKSLKEELQALLSDKAGEAEYVQTLQHQIMRLKEISHTVRCSCGGEYIVKLDV
ncbi:leucine zipper protein 1 [Striga asiatica]|uniref:Leucine zipper protein 1 n=1 Tax=Striga asiatica TaxID=4170 RepID=A0A5A7P455_STRAF|nr:leucine zipper protein 1 [Striga asiatica]